MRCPHLTRHPWTSRPIQETLERATDYIYMMGWGARCITVITRVGQSPRIGKQFSRGRGQRTTTLADGGGQDGGGWAKRDVRNGICRRRLTGHAFLYIWSDLVCLILNCCIERADRDAEYCRQGERRGECRTSILNDKKRCKYIGEKYFTFPGIQ